MLKRIHIIILLCLSVLGTQTAAYAASIQEPAALGQAVEKQSGTDLPRTEWGQGKDAGGKQDDKIVMKKVKEKAVKTVKLQNVVPPIHFASGEAEIPAGYVDLLRNVLDGMKGKDNVRVHFVGHTDNAQLFGEVRMKYGDNLTLSRERAGVTAEHFQRALQC